MIVIIIVVSGLFCRDLFFVQSQFLKIQLLVLLLDVDDNIVWKSFDLEY